MKVLLADDEASARRRLARLLSAYPGVEIAGEAQDGLEALTLIDSLKPDLVFLDIQMPEIDGFGVIQAMSSSAVKPLIIFATSYDQHALAAFEANALAYLLKPIEAERLSVAMDRVRLLLASETERARDEERAYTVAVSAKRLQRVVCRKGSRLLLLAPEDILWFYTDGGVVRAKTDADTYWVNYQLNQLESGLDPDVFFRARRELIVNLCKVKSVKPYDRSSFMLTMLDPSETELLVSERQAKELRERLPGL